MVFIGETDMECNPLIALKRDAKTRKKYPQKIVTVACRGGCGRTKNMETLMELGAKLGFHKIPTWTCAECYRKE